MANMLQGSAIRYVIRSEKVSNRRYEKSGVWFLKHTFHDSEGSSKLAEFFTKNVGNIVFSTLLNVYFESLDKLLIKEMRNNFSSNSI